MMKTNDMFNLSDQRNNFMVAHNKRMDELMEVLNNISASNSKLDIDTTSTSNVDLSEDSLISSIDEISESLDDLLLEISNW